MLAVLALTLPLQGALAATMGIGMALMSAHGGGAVATMPNDCHEMAGMDMANMGHNEANTVSAEPGETKELVWTFTHAGTFDFACNYPGHAEVGMEGKIVVK